MNFDLLAPFYRWIEIISAGRKLQQCRTAFLDELPAPRRILILGEGHGRSVVECLRRFPMADITCVEASASMIEQARRNLDRHGLNESRVQFIHSDVLAWQAPAGAFDLVITHFFLDCFAPNQLEVLVPMISKATTPDANWLIADFQIAPIGWRRWRSQLILWLLYRFFRLTTRLTAQELTPPDKLLEQAGFTLSKRIEFEWALLKSEWWRKGSASFSVSDHS